MFLTTRKTLRRLSSGFTLIELLIVIAIMGILAAAVLIAINPTKRTNQAKDSNVQSDVASIASAAQAYYTTPGLGTYPVDTDTLVTNGDLKSVPLNPSGVAYTYKKYPTSPACAGTAASPCTEIAIQGPVYDQASGGTKVWCWESITGKAQVISVDTNCDNAATPL